MSTPPPNHKKTNAIRSNSHSLAKLRSPECIAPKQTLPPPFTHTRPRHPTHTTLCPASALSLSSLFPASTSSPSYPSPPTVLSASSLLPNLNSELKLAPKQTAPEKSSSASKLQGNVADGTRIDAVGGLHLVGLPVALRHRYARSSTGFHPPNSTLPPLTLLSVAPSASVHLYSLPSHCLAFSSPALPLLSERLPLPLRAMACSRARAPGFAAIVAAHWARRAAANKSRCAPQSRFVYKRRKFGACHLGK